MKKQITREEILHEVEAAISVRFVRFKSKVDIIKLINEFLIFVNGQLFVLKLTEVDFEKIPPVE